jgi:hypothetical protein
MRSQKKVSCKSGPYFREHKSIPKPYEILTHLTTDCCHSQPSYHSGSAVAQHDEWTTFFWSEASTMALRTRFYSRRILRPHLLHRRQSPAFYPLHGQSACAHKSCC